MRRSQNVAIVIIGLLGAAGCAADVCETGHCEERVVVAKNLSFAMEEGDGTVAEGFDLDGIVSDGTDLPSCNQPDYVAPDGREGIDNQFAVLWEAIVDVIGDAVEGLIRGAINDGYLLFAIQLSGIDDPVNDDCVGFEVYLGEGMPLVGTDGHIQSGQTFDTRADGAVSHVECGVLEDGVLTAGPFDGIIPISILDVSFDLEVFGAMFRGELHEDGRVTGVLGAGTNGEQIIEVAEGADYRLEGLVGPLVRNRADLARDEYGDCQRLSVTLLYDGTPAYFYSE